MSSPRCQSVRRRLSEFLDDRLDRSSARAVSLHLAVCEGCRAERDALLRLSRAATELPLDAPPPGLAERVRRGPRRAAWPARIAAALLIVGGLAGAYTLGRVHGLGAQEYEPPAARVTQALPPPDAAVTPAANASTPGGSARLAPPLPTDATALRAARSLVADLELMDDVPLDLHEPMLRPQVERYDLAMWAERSANDPDLRSVAELVRRIDRNLDGGLEPFELAGLRRDAARGDVWPTAPARLVANEAAPRDLGVLLDRHARGVTPTTRRSLDAWMSFKDEWIRGDEDMALLSGLIDDLGPTLPRAAANDFEFPDLGNLYERLEWSEDEDGVRSGRLEIQQRTGSGMSVLRIEVHSSSKRSAGSVSAKRP